LKRRTAHLHLSKEFLMTQNGFFITAVSLLTLIGPFPVAAYDGLVKDYDTCTGGTAKAPRAKALAACTRLIDNSETENELVGVFYGVRAATGTSRKYKCRDARKALTLIKNERQRKQLGKLQQAVFS
jgi:hypothetical protein